MINSQFLTSNVYTAFPFRENAAGVVYPSTNYQHGVSATIPANFMVDALICIPDNVNTFVLQSIWRTGPTIWRFNFADSTGTIIFSPALTVLPTFAFDAFDIVKLVDESLRIYLSFVVTPIFNTYLQEIVVGDVDAFGATLPFESSVINTLPPRLAALTIEDILTEYAGKLKLIAGYNIEISTTKDINDTTILTLDVTPGAGKGLAPCAESTVPKLMSVIPDTDGNVEIRDKNGCYNIVPHQAVKNIEIQGDCYQCCSCSQYVNVGLAIKKIIDRAMIAKTNLMAFQTKLNEEIDKYNIKIDNCTALANFYASGRKYPDNKSGLIIIGFINSSAQYDLTIESVSVVSPASVVHVTPPGDSVPFIVPKGQTNVVMYTLATGTPTSGSWSATITINYMINAQARSWGKTFTLIEA